MVAHSTTKRFKSLEIVKLFLILINDDKISNSCYIVVLYSADKCSILLTVSLKICPIASNHNQSGDRTTKRFKSLEIVKLFLILINDDKISNSCYIVVLYSADKCSILLTVSLKICPSASNHNQSGDRTTKRFKSLEIVKLFLILINDDKISNSCYIVVLYSADKCSILLTVSLKICPIASNHNQSGDRTTKRFKSLEIVKLFLILINDDKISNSCYIVVLYSADKCSILLTVSLKICPIASNHNQSGDRTTKRFKSLEIVKLFLILINDDKISNSCYIVVLYSADKCSILLTVSLKICPIASNHNQSGDRTTKRFKSLEIVKLFLILINDDKISNSCYIVVLYSADKCSILLTVSLRICPIPGPNCIEP